MKNRWFRMLVCLVLVCCILVNISPIRAEAVTAVALTGWAILALTAALGAGVVLNPATPQIANAIGAELSKTAQRVVPDGWETIDKVCDHLDNMTPEWDPGDFHNDLKTALAGGLLTAITAMIVSAVSDGVVNTEVEEEAEEGFVYIGDSLFPDLPAVDTSVYPYITVYAFNSTNRTYLVYSTSPLFYYSDSLILCDSVSYQIYYTSSRTKWYSETGGVDTQFFKNFSGIIACNYDMCDYFNHASVKVSASVIEASSITTTVPVYPDIYVGDIPTQIENGETDEENLNIPIIDPSKFVTSPDTAYEEITNVAQQMKDGTVTYNDYVTNYQYVPTTDPDTGTDSSEPSTSTEPSEPEETEPEEEEEKPAEGFSLDLTDFFPFCIPFDIYDFFSILSASPQAPVFDWPIVVPQLGLNYTISVDLTPWDDVAALFRKMELMAFIVGLGFVTRKNFLRG